MSTPEKQRSWTVLLVSGLLCLTSCTKSVEADQKRQDGVTVVTITPQVLHTDVERFGINLGGQTYYDSGQMLRNLVARNPGFEGETWQSILRCKAGSTTSCTEGNQYTQWPAGFLDGAQFEVLSGTDEGRTGIVIASTAAAPPDGVTLHVAALPQPLNSGDFILVRLAKPGDAAAGWWTDAKGGGSFTAEKSDLSLHTSGKQALRVDADAPGASATLSSYFDSTDSHSFVQLRGQYELRFRAKPAGGNGTLQVSVSRLDKKRGRIQFLRKDLALQAGWQDYSYRFETNEDGGALGTIALQFTLAGGSALLDDVSLESAAFDKAAPAFRPEVIQALRALHPGVLRYMDSGTSFGSSLDNLLAGQFARERAGYSTQDTRQEDIPIGLDDFLQLCQAVGADPWITLPAGLSVAEASTLIDYLAGSATDPSGSRRASTGHVAPWTHAFHTIHLELGNEQWNAGSFPGASINDPVVYAHRASVIFGAMRHSPSFAPSHFDLIAGTWNAVPWWTRQEVAGSTNVDTFAVAPYLFTVLNDASSDEAVFGPMLAQPEQLDSRASGTVALQAAELHTSGRPVRLAVYEVNLGTMSGSATQAQLDSAVPSWGGGLAVADHMLLMLRDQGITTQALFCLPEFRNVFNGTPGSGRETMPLWGAVIDMGGATNRTRPSYLALQAMNQALLPTMLRTEVSGLDPTWNQPLSNNDKVELADAHELQTFAFAEGADRSVILLNLSRSQAHTVHFAGTMEPQGQVLETVIAPAHLSDSNEAAELVRPRTRTVSVGAAPSFTLPPASMTVLRWTLPR